MADLDPTADVLHQVEEDMPFSIDVRLTGTFHVAPGADLTDALTLIRELAGRGLDVDLGDGVTLHQLCLGVDQKPDLLLVSGPCADLHLTLDHMQEPVVCRTCREVYDETNGDGEDGDCPSCADARQNRREGGR